MSFFPAVGSYIVARLGEASTYAGAAAIVQSVITHQSIPAIATAALGFLAVVLPASILDPVRSALAPKSP